MSQNNGWTERFLAWTVADDEAVEGLLGDVQEELGEGRSPLRTLRYKVVVLGLALRYLVPRLVGGGGGASGDGLVRDIRFALRSILRSRGYSALFVATLALGLGATLTVFTVLDSVVLRPLPYDEPEELIRIQSAVPGMGPDTRWNLAKAQYLYLRDELTTVSAIGLYVLNVATVGGADGPDGQAERISVADVNADLFTALRITPALGRSFNAAESLDQAAATVMLSDGYWTRAFGGDPSIVGQTMLINGRSIEIVGVLPTSARLPEEVQNADLDVDLWTPIYVSPAERPVNSHQYRSVARLAPGSDVEALNAELRRLSERLPDAIPIAYSAQFMEQYGFFTMAEGLQDNVIGDITRTLWIVFGAVGLLLAVAAFNSANLALARAQRRSRELGVRAALGAGRGALGRQLILEATLLSLIAGVVAVALAYLGAQTLTALAPDGLPRVESVSLSPTSLGLAAALSLGVGLFFGMLPLMGRSNLTRVLGDGSRGMTVSRSHHAARQVLVVAQLAASLVLLAGATLLFQSYRNLSNVDTGIEPDDVLTFRVILPGDAYPDYAAAAAFYRQTITELEAQPTIRVAGAVSALPLSGFDGCSVSFPEGYQRSEGDPPPCLPSMLVSPGYFEAMGIPVRGQGPTWDAVEDQRLEVFVAEATARRFWGEEDGMGRGVSSWGTPHIPVQAVVGDVRGAGPREPAWDAVYMSMVPPGGVVRYWNVPRFFTFVVRTDGTDPALVAPIARQVVAGVDARVPLSDVQPMSEVVATMMARDSFIALLLGVASALSLLLSALGVYAVISYIVQGRRGEIGVRLALGAERGQVRGLVVGQSLRLAVRGGAVGLALAVPVARVLRSFLFEMSPSDPLTLALASVALVAVAAVASFAPALRATRIDPVEALRSD